MDSGLINHPLPYDSYIPPEYRPGGATSTCHPDITVPSTEDRRKPHYYHPSPEKIQALK